MRYESLSFEDERVIVQKALEFKHKGDRNFIKRALQEWASHINLSNGDEILTKV